VWAQFVRIIRDRTGQDLIEYALMAGFVAVSAGALLPNIATSISSIFSQVGSVVALAAG
jgi:Flp pilus assembly pilin Flp